MIHSFNIGSDTYTIHLVLFQAANEPVWLRATDPQDVVISIAGVYRAFVRAIGRYESELRADPRPCRRSSKGCLEKYGQLGG